MGKTKKKSKSFIEKIAAILLIVFCGCFLAGCMGGGGSSSGSSGSSSGSNSGSSTDKNDKDNPYDGSLDSVIDDFNQVFMGGIGVYEVESSAEVFADNYTGNNVNFNFLVDRQFNTLATVLYESLNYVYGTKNFSVSIGDYAASESNISLLDTEFIKSNVYKDKEDESMLYYRNAMNGGYAIKTTPTAEQDTNPDGTPMEDGSGNPIYKLAFSYGSELNTDKKWKKIPTKDSMLADLKYIYQNIQEPADMAELDFDDNSLKDHYAGSQFVPTTVDNNEIKTIGLSQAYMWNVLYYLAYSVIGSANINASNEAKPYVVNGNTINEINRLNYTKFEQYKGYDTILLEIVTNAFKLVKDGNNIKVSSNYSYSAIDWETTLFPNMARYQFVYYEDIDDIRDAEFSGADYDGTFDPKNPTIDESFKDKVDIDEDFDIDNIEVKSEKVKLGSARKLKEIIYLPQYADSFEVSMLSIAFVRAKDVANGTSVQIYTNVYGAEADKKPIYSELVDIDDGTYRVELPGGAVIEGGDASECEYLAKGIDDALIIEYEESSGNGECAKNRVFADVFKEADSKDYKLSNVAIDGVTQSDSDIKKSFTQANYTCAGEEITAYNLNVCNNIVALDSSGNYSLNLQNVISFQFKYYDSSNKEINTPLLYLMSFRFM